jgi:hypothetical protein
MLILLSSFQQKDKKSLIMYQQKGGTMTTFRAKHISVSINKPAGQVYDFVSDPENLPKWASGLSSSVKKSGDGWIAESPMGDVKVEFAAKNNFGILDHEVTLPSGEKVLNPMRVFPNGNGSELVFTVFQLPGRADEEYLEDTQMVAHDLKTLKEIMER